jgi:hypothetical protein
MSYLLLGSDVYLVGLGFTVAIVIYPSFHLVGSRQWARFHEAHERRNARAVAPAWIVQGIGSLWWLIHGPHRTDAFAHAMLAL